MSIIEIETARLVDGVSKRYDDLTEKYSSNRHRRTTVKELEEKHGHWIGEKVRVKMKVASVGRDTMVEKKVRCKIIGMYENYVALETKFGYCRSMFWKDFEKALE